MNDIDDFFAEHDERMSIPDEDVDEYIQTRLAGTQRNRSTVGHVDLLEDTGVAPHRPVNSQRRESLGPQLTGENSRVETVDARSESVYFACLPGPSSITPAAAHPAKRRKTVGDHSTPKPIDCVLPARTTESLDRDPSALRATTQKEGAFSVKHSLQFSSANPVKTRVSGQAHPEASSRNGVSSPTGPAPEYDRQLELSFVQMVQTADQAVSATEDLSGSPTRAKTPGSEMRVQAPEKRMRDAPPLSTAGHPSIVELVSFPPVLSPHNVAVLSATSLDGHGKDSLHLSVTSRIPEVSSIETVYPTFSGTSSPRIAGESHEVGCIREDPVPRTPTGFNTVAHLRSSSITSPQNTLSGQSHHAKEPKTRKTLNSGKKSRKETGSKRLKDKPKLITPLEYAQKLQSSFDPRVKTNYLKGKHIFYVGGDMMYASTTTKGRMEYIMKHGGTLVPRYDPDIVTHIVTDASIRSTLQALSLKSLSDIPSHIPTVTWNWVVSGYGRASEQKSTLLLSTRVKGKAESDKGDDDDPFDSEFMHAAFLQRIDAGHDWKTNRWGKQIGKTTYDLALGSGSANHDSGDSSHISAFSQENKPTQPEGRAVPLVVLPPPPLGFKSIPDGKDERRTTLEREKAVENDDPLAEYYAQARADREAQWSQDASDSDDGDDDVEFQRGQVPKRGFTCDLKGHKPTVCVNRHIVDKLEELRELHKAKTSEHDRWRAYSYGKCIPAVRDYPKPIRSFSEARSIRGVGEKTALKIMEIINTGDLKRIKYEATEEVAATRAFQGIYGVGRYTAFSWFATGLRTLDDVRARKGGLKLSTAQEIGLKFYDDINSRMPREEAGRIFEMIKPIALAIDSKLFIEIMGSYRRGKADCGDIDILITRPTADGKTHQGVLRTLLERLHVTGIITEDLAVPDDFSDLELIYRGLSKLPESDAKRRRIDFLCVPWASRGAALLYYTGDDIFNRAMRYKANKHGFSLNQRGLYAGVLRDPNDRQKKVCEGHVVASETEEEIFKILGVPWQEPHERVRG